MEAWSERAKRNGWTPQRFPRLPFIGPTRPRRAVGSEAASAAGATQQSSRWTQSRRRVHEKGDRALKHAAGDGRGNEFRRILQQRAARGM